MVSDCPLTLSRTRAWWPGVPWEQDGSGGGVLMVSTLWALPVLRPVILTRREGDKGQPVTVTVSLSIFTDQDSLTYLRQDFSWLPSQIILRQRPHLSLVSCADLQTSDRRTARGEMERWREATSHHQIWRESGASGLGDGISSSASDGGWLVAGQARHHPPPSLPPPSPPSTTDIPPPPSTPGRAASHPFSISEMVILTF